MPHKKLLCIAREGAVPAPSCIGTLEGWDICMAATLRQAARELRERNYLVGLVLGAGGFTLGGGLQVALGIERLVSINGNMVSRTLLQVPDMTRLNHEQARQTGEALASVQLIQNGHDNFYTAAMAPQMLGGTVIQNSLNDQLIRSQTVIHASVNSMGLFKTLNFQGSLGEAIARTAGPH